MGQKDDQETDDFVASVIAEASQIIRYKYEGFVAVIAPYDDIGLPKDLPQLSLLVGADKYEVPGVWFYQGALQEYLKYDFPMEKGKFNSEMLLVWARHASMKIEKPHIVKHIEDLKANPDSNLEELAYYEEMFINGENEIKELEETFLGV
jgi:hypothetical protein